MDCRVHAPQCAALTFDVVLVASAAIPIMCRVGEAQGRTPGAAAKTKT